MIPFTQGAKGPVWGLGKEKWIGRCGALRRCSRGERLALPEDAADGVRWWAQGR